MASEKQILNALNRRLRGLMSAENTPAELTEEIIVDLAPSVAGDVSAVWKTVEAVIRNAVPSILENWHSQATQQTRGSKPAPERTVVQPAPQENTWQAVMERAVALGRSRGAIGKIEQELVAFQRLASRAFATHGDAPVDIQLGIVKVSGLKADNIGTGENVRINWSFHDVPVPAGLLESNALRRLFVREPNIPSRETDEALKAKFYLADFRKIPRGRQEVSRKILKIGSSRSVDIMKELAELHVCFIQAKRDGKKGRVDKGVIRILIGVETTNSSQELALYKTINAAFEANPSLLAGSGNSAVQRGIAFLGQELSPDLRKEVRGILIDWGFVPPPVEATPRRGGNSRPRQDSRRPANSGDRYGPPRR